MNYIFKKYNPNLKKGVRVKIQMSDGKKCPRCWKIFLEKVESQELCSRCKNVIDEVTHK